MKYAAILLLMVMLVPTALAQSPSADVITLNDATPGIDVVITPPPGTTGAVVLQLSGASVSVTDETGIPVLEVADSRLHGLELHFAPDATPHTVSVQRLSGVSEAYVTITAQEDFTMTAMPSVINEPVLTLGQAYDLDLTASAPGQTVQVVLAENSEVMARFPAASVMAQVVDADGVVVSTLAASQLDGLVLALDTGEYELTLLSGNTAQDIKASVSVLPAPEAILPAAVATQPTVASTVAPASCAFTISLSSTELRSGPGTGYSITSYTYRNEQLTVGGINPEKNWLLVNGVNGTAWINQSTGLLTGDCAALTVYNLPLRDAPPVQINIQEGTNGEYEHEEDEHEENEHEEHEEEGDDD